VELSTISLIIMQHVELRSIQLGRWGWNSGCNTHVLHYHGTQTVQSSQLGLCNCAQWREFYTIFRL